MKTVHVVSELSSYIDNQLTAEEKQRVDEHLKLCHYCARELADLRTLSAKLKAWQASDAGPFFDQAVKDTIAAGKIERSAVQMKTKPGWYLVPSGIIVMIVVFMLVGPIYMRRGMSGRLRDSADDMGMQYDPAKALLSSSMKSTANGGISRMASNKAMMMPQYSSSKVGGLSKSQYEPYYQRSAGSTETSSYVQHNQAAVTETRDRADYGQVSNAPLPQYPYAPPAETMPQVDGSVIIIQPVLPATGVGDKIIRTAEIKLEVQNGQEAYKKVSAICQELGGYLATSNFYQDQEGREAGTITLRIPKDKFLIALDKLGELGKIAASSSQSQDVGQEYANLKSHLDAAMVVYNKMVEALQKKQVTIPEAARLESELTPVLERVEALKNKIEALNNLVSFTTITVSYYEPLISTKALKDSKKYIDESILTAKINGVKFLASAIPAAMVIVFWVIVTVGVFALLKFIIVRVFKRE